MAGRTATTATASTPSSKPSPRRGFWSCFRIRAARAPTAATSPTACAVDWGGEDYLDLMAVIDSVLERPYADANRTGIWGYSYGGYMTAWTIGHTQRFQAAVCGAPCFDLESMYGTSDISHAWGRHQWGGTPHEASEAFAAHSPSTFAHRATTPTLIMQGEADDRCPIGQGEQMFVALKQAGCEVEFARYPGGVARHAARGTAFASSGLHQPPGRLVRGPPWRRPLEPTQLVSRARRFSRRLSARTNRLAGAGRGRPPRSGTSWSCSTRWREDVPAYRAFLQPARRRSRARSMISQASMRGCR